MMSKKTLSLLAILFSLQLPVMSSQAQAPQAQVSVQAQETNSHIRNAKSNPVKYERTDSETVSYQAPDPTVLPIELRMQSMERKLTEQDQQIEELQNKLTDTINVLNNVTRNLKNQ